MICCTLNTWILTYKLLAWGMHNPKEHKCQSSQNICLKISRNGLGHTSLCLVALFVSMVRSKLGTRTPRFLKCHSAVLLFPVKIVSRILHALQFTWRNEDKLLGRNPEVLENWISGSSKKEQATPQNRNSKTVSTGVIKDIMSQPTPAVEHQK
jgi:hypothetical protein